MQCDDCHTELGNSGLLVTTKDYEKKWVCSECFIKRFIKGGVELVHHWGYVTLKVEKEPKPEPE